MDKAGLKNFSDLEAILKNLIRQRGASTYRGEEYCLERLKQNKGCYNCESELGCAKLTVMTELLQAYFIHKKIIRRHANEIFSFILTVKDAEGLRQARQLINLLS